jgi:predicted amidohydrolase
MAQRLRVALIQQTAVRDFGPNLLFLETHIRKAASDGAQLIVTPENCAMLEPDPEAHLLKALPMNLHPLPTLFRQLALQTKTWLLAGSIALKVSKDKLVNRSLLFGPDGALMGQYDKIHLFDVNLANGESYLESKIIQPGNQAVVVPTPFAKLGLAICYDLRFPALFRSLAQNGASILTLPSAFTVPTGEAHWHSLIRARAIENGCFVLAPAQTGTHALGRKTYGHSLVVGPWGEVIAEAGTDPCILMADLDLTQAAKARQRVPSLSHDRPFTLSQL